MSVYVYVSMSVSGGEVNLVLNSLVAIFSLLKFKFSTLKFYFPFSLNHSAVSNHSIFPFLTHNCSPAQISVFKCLPKQSFQDSVPTFLLKNVVKDTLKYIKRKEIRRLKLFSMELVKYFFVSDLWSVLHGQLFCFWDDIFVFTRDKSNIIGDITLNGLAVYSRSFPFLCN